MKHSKSNLRRLLELTKPHILKIVIASLCVLLVNSAEIIKPYILKIVIDDFLVKHSPQKGMHSIYALGISYFIVVALGGFFSISGANIINKVGQKITFDLRNKVFKTIQMLPLSFLDKTSSGSLITRATNDVEALSEMYTDVIINLFQDVFLLIGIIYAMAALNIKLTLVSFSVIPLMFLFIFMLRRKIKRNFAKMKKLIGKINGFMAENISGMKIIQIFRIEKEKKKEFNKLNNEYFKVTKFQVWMNSFLKPAADVFQNITVAILIWYGMNKIGNHTLQLGVLYAFTNYIKQFFDPISDLADNYTTIQSALVSAGRIFELLDQNNILENIDSGISMNHIKGNIEFKNVWFAYSKDNWVLKNINFKLKEGQTAAFVGETGAGKSTIISLISGFYKIQKGQILIDGININDIKKEELRKNIAVVLQDVFLFSGTIEKNIALNDDIDKKTIQRALKMSNCMDFINKLPNKINEPVMERGVTFSSGQRQLLSFARAIAHNPSILVLDEATSNIDTETEMLIQDAIKSITENRTTLIVAHRLSTIKNADKIIVIKDGKIVEMGNHDELILQNGYYKNMVINSL